MMFGSGKLLIVVAWLILAEVILSCLFILPVCHVGKFCSLVHWYRMVPVKRGLLACSGKFDFSFFAGCLMP
jgi:esterase/lipase superfamily enzyme